MDGDCYSSQPPWSASALRSRGQTHGRIVALNPAAVPTVTRSQRTHTPRCDERSGPASSPAEPSGPVPIADGDREPVVEPGVVPGPADVLGEQPEPQPPRPVQTSSWHRHAHHVVGVVDAVLEGAADVVASAGHEDGVAVAVAPGRLHADGP